jgi:hypothetical protein
MQFAKYITKLTEATSAPSQLTGSARRGGWQPS